MKLLGLAGQHFGFGRDDLLDTPIPELTFWVMCSNAVRVRR